MTEKQAIQEGLHFTGVYNFAKEDTKNKIDEERKKYPKARIVLVTTKSGYSAYADNVYSAYKKVESIKPRINTYQERLNKLKVEYEELVKSAEESCQSDRCLLHEAEEVLANA